ncbi:hypothetical protein AOLI_G00084680 [Acnodon oligacanthus]
MGSLTAQYSKHHFMRRQFYPLTPTRAPWEKKAYLEEPQHRDWLSRLLLYHPDSSIVLRPKEEPKANALGSSQEKGGSEQEGVNSDRKFQQKKLARGLTAQHHANRYTPGPRAALNPGKPQAER